MKLTDIQNIVIAQAIEESDSGGTLLSDGEKRLADAAAGAPLPSESGKTQQNKFLAKRGSHLIRTVESRLEGDRDWLRGSSFRGRFGLFAFLFVIAAALVGYLTNELGPDRKINLLSFPLIGIVAWNLFVYVSELIILFRKNGAITGVSGIICRAIFPPTIESPKGENEGNTEFRARSLFQSRWRHLNLPPLAGRVKSLLHFTAMILAASAISGMYVKGLAREYNAIWESTFFQDGEQLHPFLKTVLGPAASIEGTPLPDASELDRLHWSEPNGAEKEDNAAKWIHWYAITIALYVLIPRFILGIFWHVRAATMERHLPFREISPNYYDRVIAVSTGDSLNIAIVPYAHKPGDNVKQGIRTHMEKEFERAVTIHWQDDIAFGDEDDAEVEIPNHLLPMLLFNFASTPEKETHLALYKRLRENHSEQPLPYHIVLDCEAFDRKSESFNDADERRATRFEAWNKLFANENCEIHVISDHHFVVKEIPNG